MKKRKGLIKIAMITSQIYAAIKIGSQYYNLLHLDTGRCYRYVANIKISEPLNIISNNKRKMKKLKIKDLQTKAFTDKVATVASI